MMCSYSPELTEPVISDEPGIKVYDRCVTFNIQLVHFFWFDIVIDIVTDYCVHACS